MFLITPFWLLIVLSVLCFLLLLLFLIPLISGVRHAGTVTGTIVSLLLFAYLTANSFAAGWLGAMWEHGTGHTILCIVLGLLAVLVLWCLYLSIRMTVAILRKPPKPMPAIVLGCSERKQNGNRMLDARIQAAFDYLKKNPETAAILCGGCAASQRQSEAEYMQDRLLDKGIARGRLYLDEDSRTTQEKLINAAQLLSEHKLGKSAVLITSEFHQYRCSLIAKELGMKTWHLSSHGPWYLVPGFWVREWLLMIRRMLFA